MGKVIRGSKYWEGEESRWCRMSGKGRNIVACVEAMQEGE